MTEYEKYIYELTNNYERAVFLKGDSVHARETTRYLWARNNVFGKKVLEIGCSSGYGYQFLPEGIDYTGIDYDSKIIEVAKNQQWGSNAKFHYADINTFPLDQYDTIIAFEVIEHLDNGLEIVEKLKKHCKRLLITVPHNEPKGFWGEHHKLHGLNESHFNGFKFNYINMDGRISGFMQPVSESNPANLMICSWDKKETVLCSIATRGRYHTTLPMVIEAIINQTQLPDKLMIFDDNDEPKDLRSNFLYTHLFHILDVKGIKWEWVFAGKKGQHHIHQMANTQGFDWVWRVDDDAIPEPNVLERLYEYTGLHGVGAIGGSVITPPLNPQFLNSSGLMDNIEIEPNIQWGLIKELKQVEHLYCSFLYRAGVHDYNLGLSRVAHREETLFSYGLHLKGYKLYVVPDAITWHLKNPEGGIRSETKAELYDHDEQIFRNVINFKSKKIVVLNCGMGDHVVFSKVLPDIENAEVFGCYPEIIPCRPIAEAQALFGDIEQFNIYKKMIEWNWKGSLEDAFRKLYL
jgi:SAM-dependent methyltransferase